MPETPSDDDQAGPVQFHFAIPDGKPGSGLTLMIGPDWHNKLNSFRGLAAIGTEETGDGPVLRTIYMPPLEELADRQPPGEPQGAVYRFKCAPDSKTKHRLIFDALAEVWDNDDYKKQFDLWLGQLLPGFGWSLQQPRSASSSFEIWSRYWRRPDFDRGGPLVIFYVLLHLIDVVEEQVLIDGEKAAGALAIDRPEELLSAFSLERLAEIVGEISQNRQVFIATGVAELARWQDYVNGAQIQIFGLNEAGRIKFSQWKAKGVYASVIKSQPRDWVPAGLPPPGDQSQALAVFEIDERGRDVKAEVQVEEQEDPPWLEREASPEEAADRKIQRAYREMLNCDGLVIAADENLKRAILQWFVANKTRPGGVVSCYDNSGVEMKVLLAMAADSGIDRVVAVYGASQSSAEALAADKAVFHDQFGQKGWLFVSLPDVVVARPGCGKCRYLCQCPPKGIGRVFGGKGKSPLESKTQKVLAPKMRQLIQYFN